MVASRWVARLAFQEDRAQVPRLGHRRQRGAVGGLLFFKGETKYFRRQRRRHEAEQFVRSEHVIKNQ